MAGEMTEFEQGERAGYVLIVGPRGPERTRIFGTLKAAAMEVYAATEAEVLAIPDLLSPALTVLADGGGGREQRQAALEKLLAYPPLVGVPILVVAGARDIDSFTGAITKGAAAYLAQPVDEGELVSTARRLSDWRDTHGCTEKRRRVRRPLILKVEVTVRSTHEHVPGQMLDVSSRGCRLEVEREVREGERVRIVLHGPEGSTHVALGAVVRWHARAGERRHLLGLRFSGSTAVLAPALLGAPGAQAGDLTGSNPGSAG